MRTASREFTGRRSSDGHGRPMRGFIDGQLEALKWIALGFMLVNHFGRLLLGFEHHSLVRAAGGSPARCSRGCSRCAGQHGPSCELAARQPVSSARRTSTDCLEHAHWEGRWLLQHRTCEEWPVGSHRRRSHYLYELKRQRALSLRLLHPKSRQTINRSAPPALRSYSTK